MGNGVKSESATGHRGIPWVEASYQTLTSAGCAGVETKGHAALPCPAVQPCLPSIQSRRVVGSSTQLASEAWIFGSVPQFGY
jgi:hypothetical protein